MARSKKGSGDAGDGVISIVGPDMEITGDLITEGSVRIEGRVNGNVRAEKAVVVGKDGSVNGDVQTQDAIVTGRIDGCLTAASRLEVQATARIEGDIHARRIELEEGAMVNGRIQMSDDVCLEADPGGGRESDSASPAPGPTPGNASASGPS